MCLLLLQIFQVSQNPRLFWVQLSTKTQKLFKITINSNTKNNYQILSLFLRKEKMKREIFIQKSIIQVARGEERGLI